MAPSAEDDASLSMTRTVVAMRRVSCIFFLRESSNRTCIAFKRGNGLGSRCAGMRRACGKRQASRLFSLANHVTFANYVPFPSFLSLSLALSLSLSLSLCLSFSFSIFH